MGIKVALPCRPVGAVGTSIWLLARVGPDVGLEVPLLCGAEGAVLTGEWLLPRVGPQVIPKVGGHLTGIRAVGTMMGLVTVVAIAAVGAAAEALHGSCTSGGSSSSSTTTTTTCLRLAITLRPHL